MIMIKSSYHSLLVLRTLLAIHQKWHEPSEENHRVFCFINKGKSGSFNEPLATIIISLFEFKFTRKKFILLMKEVIFYYFINDFLWNCYKLLRNRLLRNSCQYLRHLLFD